MMSLGEAPLIAASLVTMPAALKRPSPRLYKNGRPSPRTRVRYRSARPGGGRLRKALRYHRGIGGGLYLRPLGLGVG